MKYIPQINFRRTMLIARRDYLGYVRTWGFWISFSAPFIFVILGVFLSSANIEISRTQYIAVIDNTGEYFPGISDYYDDIYKEKSASFRFITSPKMNLDELTPYLVGDITRVIEGEVSVIGGALIVKEKIGSELPNVEYWSTRISKMDAPNFIYRYQRYLKRGYYLEKAGLTVEGLDEVIRSVEPVKLYNPIKTEVEDKSVNSSDTIPYLSLIHI